MLRLVFEAVLIIAIVSALFFMMKITGQENQGERIIPDEKDESD